MSQPILQGPLCTPKIVTFCLYALAEGIFIFSHRLAAQVRVGKPSITRKYLSDSVNSLNYVCVCGLVVFVFCCFS